MKTMTTKINQSMISTKPFSITPCYQDAIKMTVATKSIYLEQDKQETQIKLS